VCLIGGPGLASGRGGRQDGQTGGEILPVRIHRRVEKCKRRLLSGLVLFMLVTPPLQLTVVGLYLVQGVWFPSRLPLK
jgi:hypothetical protein